MTGPHDSIIGVEIRRRSAVPDRAAAQIRDGDRQPAAERGDRRGGRADRPRDRHRASEPERSTNSRAATADDDLFDLPFEEDDEPERRAEPPPSRLRAEDDRDADRSQRGRVLTVTELTVRVRDLLESEFFESLGRRRALELPRLEHRPSLFHAEGRASQLRGVIFRRRCAI
jgi:hypothetical protein